MPRTAPASDLPPPFNPDVIPPAAVQAEGGAAAGAAAGDAVAQSGSSSAPGVVRVEAPPNGAAAFDVRFELVDRPGEAGGAVAARHNIELLKCGHVLHRPATAGRF